jgi:hypothetical protein
MKIFYQETRTCSRKNHGCIQAERRASLDKGRVTVDVSGEEMIEKEVKLAGNSG